MTTKKAGKAALATGATVNNRYRILDLLGEGGMGRVFLVADELHGGRKLALKTMRPELASREFVGFFSHEFEALTKLRHPNLAEVYDFGQIGATGHYFFTLEYVVGANLYEATEGAGRELVLEYLVQVCRGLEYTHSRGLIHHDIKPENILVLAGEGGVGRIKLMDFGLALEEELAADAGSIRGTLQYLAPEIARSLPYDRRADLYSLGVVLFRILRPDVPVSSDDPTQDRLYNYNVPPPPDLDGATLDPRFRALLRRMVASDPAARYHSANQVIEEVNTLFGTSFATQTLESKVGYVLSGKFVGRAAELERLARALRALQDGRAPTPFLLFGGQAGIGKSRLLREWQVGCQLAGVHFVQARCYEHLTVPYGPVADLLRQVVSLAGPASELVARHRPDLGRLVPELAGQDRTGPEDADALRMINSLTRFLIDASVDRPIVLSLVDLQWADAGTIELLKYLVRSLFLSYSEDEDLPAGGAATRSVPRILDLWERRRRPSLALAGSYRDDEAGDSPLAEAISELEGDRYLERIPLARLDAALVRELVGSMLGAAHPPLEFSRRLTEETDGNPYYIEQLMKSLVEENQLDLSPGWNISIAPDALALPSSCDQLIQRRLARVDDQARQVLDLLAVIGRPATLAFVQALELPGLEPYVGLRQLERLDLALRDRSEEGNRYGLKQASIRRVVYQEIPPERRRTLHRAVAAALEALHGQRTRPVIVELAHHHIQGGNRDQAILFGMQAARQSAELHAHAQAIGLYREVLPLLDEGDRRQRGAVLSALGDLHKSGGGYDEARASYEQAMALSADAGERAALLRSMGETAARQGRHEEAIELYRRTAQALEGVEGAGALRAHLLVSHGRIEELGGRYDAGLEMAQAALALDPPEEVAVTAYQLLGNLCWCLGRYQEAVAHHERSLEIEQARENTYGLAACYNNLALVAQDLGQTDRALALYHKSLEQWEKYGDPRGRAQCSTNLGILNMERGDYATAERYHKEALATFEKLGDRGGIGWVSECLGEVYGALGRWIESEVHYQRCLELCERSGNVPLSIYAYLNLGETYATFGALTQALALVEKGVALAEELENRFLVGAGDLLRGEIHRRKGNWDAALSCLQQAHGQFSELGNRPEAVKAAVYMARLLHGMGELGGAEQWAQQTLGEARELGNREQIAELHHLLGELHQLQGRFEEARRAIDAAIEVARELGRQELLWRVRHDSGRLYYATGDLLRSRDEYLQAVELGKRTWEALPPGLQQSFLQDPRHQELKHDIAVLKNRMLGRSEHVD